MTRHFEDVVVGETHELGSREVTAAEIRAFAERYDPQWFHLDADRARAESPYGGLIASGWHTAAVTMRLLVDGYLSGSATLGAKGVDELRWHRPVRPGDRLAVRTTALEKTTETPARGLVRAEIETLREGELVLSMVGLVLFARRDG